MLICLSLDRISKGNYQNLSAAVATLLFTCPLAPLKIGKQQARSFKLLVHSAEFSWKPTSLEVSKISEHLHDSHPRLDHDKSFYSMFIIVCISDFFVISYLFP